jgi:AcrR family transcriptional regulator/alkylation response protein AidB-like acyl-CoA dehydrogenase
MMTILWSPSLDPAAARWKARARSALADSSRSDPITYLNENGLLKMLSPNRQGGASASVRAIVSVLETLAAPRAEASLLLANALAGSWPLLMLGSVRQKKEWLGRPANGYPPWPPLLLAPEETPGNKPAFTIERLAQAWNLHGRARWTGAAKACSGFVVFTQETQKVTEDRVSAFLIPRTALDLPAKSSWYGTIMLDMLLPPGLRLGTTGEAQQAMDASFALHRIAVAAQAMGVCLAAYKETLRIAHDAGIVANQGHPALKLAYCAAAISSSRMSLYEAARAADAGEDIVALSALAALSAHDCADKVISTALEIASNRSSADLTPLQVLLRARQLHRAGTGAPKEQAGLLAGAIAPLSKAVKTGDTTMSKPARARSGESPDRVSEILDAAADAFTQQSYDATTLDYIGDAIGATKGSIYYHYRSKADLFVAVYRRAMELNIETVEPIADQKDAAAIDRLYRMAYAHSLQVMKHLSYQRVAVQGLESHLMSRVTDEQRASLAEVISLRDQYEELFVRTIKQAVDAGELPQQNAQLAVKPLFGAINWTTMWYQPRAGETPADRERIAAQLAGFVVSGLKQSYQPVFPVAASTLSDNIE